tara:strand:- start:960 stop:1154 length:195 start_codon:yes stop_codon:yes gene_type:complete
MAKVIFDDLTMEQAKTLASWYSGQGEQDCAIWFEANGDIPVPYVDDRKTKIDEESETVYVYIEV